MTERIHLVVATPCFGGQVSSIYASSIFKLQSAIRSKANLELKVLLRDGDALITRARANLMTQFLDDPTATHFLFVDADIGFTPRAGVPADRVRRRRGGRRLSDQARQLGQGEADDRGQRPNVPSAALDYVLEIDDPDHVVVVNGFTRVRYAGTGFLMIRRHVFEKMCASGLCVAAVLSRAFARCAGRKSQPVCLVRMHDRSDDRNLSQRGFCVLQTLDRYRR